MPRRHRFRLLAFDWDGTLADSTALIAGAIQQACRDVGLAAPDDQAARHVIGLGPRDAMEADRHAGFSERFRAHYMAGDAEVPLFEGVREMLDDLDARGFLLAIATGKTRVGLARALAQHKIAHRFAASRCADEGLPKPHPDMLLALMDRVGVDASETLMIGDTSHDLELARNAGALGLAVGYGAHSLDELARFAPVAAVRSVAELRLWLAANA